MQENTIGIFDSGVGGSSIWKEIATLLPGENTIYLADSNNAPYGVKSREDIIALSIKNTEKLLEFNAKIIVVACNTATTNAIKILRSTYDIPFIGIEPAIKPAAINTLTKKVGILATKGTLSSALFAKTSDLYARDIEVIEVTGTGLVELIEEDKLDSPEMRELLMHYLHPMIEKKIDYLVLGCSHYPYLIPELKKILSNNVTIIDSGEAVAKQTKKILSQNNLLSANISGGIHSFYTNSTPNTLQRILQNSGFSFSISYLDF